MLEVLMLPVPLPVNPMKLIGAVNDWFKWADPSEWPEEGGSISSTIPPMVPGVPGIRMGTCT